MFLVMSDDCCHVSQKMIQYSTTMLGAELSDGTREHILALTCTQHVYQQFFVYTPVRRSLETQDRVEKRSFGLHVSKKGTMISDRKQKLYRQPEQYEELR